MADEYNGKAVWLLSDSESEGSHTIMAVKRILLADYAFEHGGYVVVHLKPDLMDSIAQDLKRPGRLHTGIDRLRRHPRLLREDLKGHESGFLRPELSAG